MTTVLCIEDDPDLRQILVDVLEEAGFDVATACDGRDGLDKIKRCQPDLAISDITMPGMDGYALLKALREDGAQFAQMPFIFLSALAGRDARIEGLNRGADEYLTKPVDLDILVSKVRSILRMNERIKKDYEQDRARLLECQQDAYVDGGGGLDDDLVLS